MPDSSGRPVDEGRLRCVRDHGEGQFHRSGCPPKLEKKEDALSDIFTPKQKETIDAAIDYMKDVISKHAPYVKVNLDQYKSTKVSFC